MNTFKSLLLSSLLAISPVIANSAPTLELSGTGSLDVRIEDLDELEDYGSVFSIRDLDLRADSQLTEWLSARIILACESSAVENADDCATDSEQILKDFTVGIMIPEFGGQKMAVLIGKTELPFGGNTTKRAVDIHNPQNLTDRELQRKKVIMLQWAPSVAGDSKTASIMNSLFSLVEVAAYGNNSSNLSDYKETEDIENFAMRVSGALKSLFYTASYLDEKHGETRWGASAGMPVLNTGFSVYGEYQNYKNNAINPDLESSTTVGVSKSIMGGSGAFELSNVERKNIDSQKRMSVSYTHPVGKYVSVGGEVDSETDFDDVAAYLTVNGHFGKSKNIETRSVFPALQSKVDAQRAKVEALSKASKK